MDFFNDHLLSLIAAAPFLAAVVLLVVPDQKRLAVRVISLVGAMLSMIGSVIVALTYDMNAGGFQRSELIEVVPSYGIDLRLAVDGWGVSLLLLTGVVIVTGVTASWSMNKRSKDFFIMLLVLVAGVFGVFVCQDLFMFFLFYEIAVLPMYLLIGIWGSEGHVEPKGPFKFVWKRFNVGGRGYSAMKLTLMLIAGSAAILVVIFGMYHNAGGKTFDMGVLGSFAYDRNFQIWAFPLAWFGFGALGGVFPFHTWSPDGHAAAPTAVSMLHAGVLMKLGAFGVIRVGMMMLPEGAIFWAPYVGFVAVINIFYGAVSAMHQKDLKYIVAYSSVSHMGVVMLGAATLTQSGWNGAIYQMFAHGMMTALFFSLIGLVYGQTHTRLVTRMGGFAKVMPKAAVFFTIAGLSSLGLPGLAGFVAEFLVFLGAWESEHAWWAIPGILGAWITAVYVLRAIRDVFWGPGPAEEWAKANLHDARGIEWVALYTLGACLIIFGCYPRLILDFIQISTGEYLPALKSAVQVGLAVAQ